MPRPLPRSLRVVLVLALLVQLVLGVRTRHTGDGTMLHITFAVVVLIVAIVAAVRAMGGDPSVPAFRKTGGALMGHAMTQLVLGGFAFMLVSQRGGEGTPPLLEVIAATLHQTVGALLLANAALSSGQQAADVALVRRDDNGPRKQPVQHVG